MIDNAIGLIRWAKKELERSDVPCAEKDAETLFMHSFKTRRENIYAAENFIPCASRAGLFRRNVRLRGARLPLQYIVGNTEFMGLAFEIERDIFIPRPETELLVEKVLEYIGAINKKRINILEIGTGCGNIAISLTKNASGCRIIASDISDKALDVAARNARRHCASRAIKFIKSNFFDSISPVYYSYFDIIVSNPPYICSAEIGHLQPEISYENRKAVDGGEDGLRSYRRILTDGIRYLKKGGIFAFEIGYNQKAALISFINRDDRFSETVVFKDYSGHQRMLITKRLRRRA